MMPRIKVGQIANPLYTLYLLIALLALLTGCTPTSPPPPPPVPRPNILIAVEGAVRLKRDGWKDYTPVGFGTLLSYDDLLEVDGSVRILCGDLTLQTLQTGTDSCPCPSWEGSFQADSGNYRGPNADIPYIQHPRDTLVLDMYPLLRWRDTGAMSYTVSLVQGGKAIWTDAAVMGNEIVYPIDEPPLQPGVDYLLEVRDNDTGVESSKDPAKGIGFRVIDQADRNALAAHCDAVSSLMGFDAPAHDYALALCYATWEPTAEGGRRPWGAAWLLLESVAQAHDDPAVYLWMGNLLAQMQSPDAEAVYRAALVRAGMLGDIESQAAAHAGLWYVMGDTAHRDNARKLYRQLGDTSVLERLD